MTDDPPAPVPGASLADDDRGVSTTLGYTLTLSITAVLVAGLLTAGGGLIEDQRNTVAADELSVSGQQLAAGFENADRLAATTDNGTVRVNVWLPEAIAGGGYELTIRNESNPPDQPALATIVASADGVEVTQNISFRTENPAANRTVPGGPVTISYHDIDGDELRELVVEERRGIRGPVSNEEVVYVDADSGNLSSLTPDGEITDYGVNASAIGPKEVDIDDDGMQEVPYVTASNDLRIIDAAGNATTLASDAAHRSQQNSFGTLLAVGTWEGETSVFYMNTSDLGNNDEAMIYRVGLNGEPTKVTAGGAGIEANAIAGVGDINDDGDDDLVYLGRSQNVWFIDDNTTIDTGQTVGADVGIGAGGPKMFAHSEIDRVPFVSSNNVKLLRHVGGSSTVTALTSGGNAAPTYVAGLDWVGDDRQEVLYVDNNNGTLRYVTLSGADGTVVGPNGNSIEVDESMGVT